MNQTSYLLDTHCLIWFLGGEVVKIPAPVMQTIQNPVNVFLYIGR